MGGWNAKDVMVAELGWLWAVDVVGDGAGVVDGSLVDGAGVDGWMEDVTADGSAVCCFIWLYCIEKN